MTSPTNRRLSRTNGSAGTITASGCCARRAPRPRASRGAPGGGGGAAGGGWPRAGPRGKPDGPLNLARVYLAQGTVQDKAVAALQRAARFAPKPAAWTLAGLPGLVGKQTGTLDQAIAAFGSIVPASGPELRERGFDFAKDYN